uniref:G protein-coupled receptor n=1 Tax=Panagrolaimus sp. PS1159 TaxID=55785 RepID=A0AC35FT06_9BILA
MGTYKYYLLNISFWSFILDIYTDIFYTPILLSPTTALCSEGILKDFNDIAVLHLPIFAILLGCCGASCLIAMIFRFFSITSSVNKLHNKSGVTVLALLHLVGLPAGIGYIYIQTEKNDKLMIMQKNYPTIYDFYQKHTCTATLSDTLAFKIVLIIAFLTFGSTGIVFGYFCHRTGRSLRLSKNVMSHRTYIMHVKMYLLLLYQSFLPLGCLAIPTMLAMYLGYIGYEDTRY